MEVAAGLEYEARGSGDVVLCIHGAIIADSFAPLMVEPALGGYRLVRFRRRGYGASAKPSDPPTVREHVRDCLALLEHVGASRTHVVAHSGGGPIAMQLAVDAPDVVRSLVLLEPALQTAAMNEQWTKRIAPLVDVYRSGQASKAVHVWMRTGASGSNWRAEIEQFIPGAGDRAVADAAGTFDGDLPAMSEWDFDSVRDHIAQPILYVVGSISAPNVERVTRVFFEAIPSAELAVIPDSDHSLHMTHAGAVAELVADFLARHPV